MKSSINPATSCHFPFGPAFFLLLLLSVEGFWTQPVAAQIEAGQEPLIGAWLLDSSVVFLVHSGGCTHRDDFGLITSNHSPLTLTLVRIRPDFCKALVPRGVPLKYTYAELGAGKRLSEAVRRTVVIQNPLINPVRIKSDIIKSDADDPRRPRQKGQEQGPKDQDEPQAGWARN